MTVSPGVRARKVLEALGPLGITAKGLADVAANMARAQEALAVQVDAAGRWIKERAGALHLEAGLWSEPGESTDRGCSNAVVDGGGDYAPRAAEVGNGHCGFGRGPGCDTGGLPGAGGLADAGTSGRRRAVVVGRVWDGRWLVEGPEGDVRVLGAEGLRQVPHWRDADLPREVLLVTPGVWEGGRLLAAPQRGFPPVGWHRFNTPSPFPVSALNLRPKGLSCVQSRFGPVLGPLAHSGEPCIG